MSHSLLAEVCLLADVFDNFRRTTNGEYNLDTAQFVRSPQLTCRAMLKYINHPLTLLSDPEMYRMIQRPVRGGICHASVR